MKVEQNARQALIKLREGAWYCALYTPAIRSRVGGGRKSTPFEPDTDGGHSCVYPRNWLGGGQAQIRYFTTRTLVPGKSRPDDRERANLTHAPECLNVMRCITCATSLGRTSTRSSRSMPSRRRRRSIKGSGFGPISARPPLVSSPLFTDHPPQAGADRPEQQKREKVCESKAVHQPRVGAKLTLSKRLAKSRASEQGTL